MKILVTGSKGCIGSILTNELVNRNHDVYQVDRTHDRIEHAFTMGFAPNGTYFKCNISEYRQIERVIDYVQPDLIYNLAAECGRWDGEDFYEDIWMTNVIGTKNILTLQKKYSFKLIHFSTSEVYADYEGIMYEKLTDEIPVFPLNDYAISKWVNEIQIRNSLNSKKCCILRIFNIYGPGEKYSPYRSLICRLVYSCLTGSPFTVFKGSRSHTYIHDAVQSIANMSNKDFFESDNFNNVINIGCDKQYDNIDIAKQIMEITKYSGENIKFSDYESQTVKHKKVDNSKARSLLNFMDTTDMQKGLIETVNWMKNNI